MEKKIGKLDDPTLDPYLNKKTMLSKFDDVKLDLESNCTFPKGKEHQKKFVFEIWRLQKQAQIVSCTNKLKLER
jgi:hypothetical protein